MPEASPLGIRERLLALIGYMPESRARRAGFTHHARLYGLIPCWYQDEGAETCVLAEKWAPLSCMDPILGGLWFLAWRVVHGEDCPPMFGIHLGPRLDPEDSDV